MDNYEIVISNTKQAQEKVAALASASKALQASNQRISDLVGKINQYWSTEQGDSIKFVGELEKCIKKVNTICSCDNELANAVHEYITAVANTANQSV
jgi:seryl-tRNA synthetase